VNNTIRDKATYAISVDVPNRLKAASNGKLVRQDKGKRRTTWHWRETRPMAPYLPTVSIGKFRFYRGRTSSGVPLLTFVDAKLSTQRRARRELGRVVETLQRRFGKYPFATSGLIIDRIDVGYALETQSRPVLPGIAPGYLIAHEIAHQWFGNSVTPRDWKDIWLNEPKSGYWKTPPGDPGSVGKLFALPIYERGAMTLQVLRERVGDRDFFRILRRWTRQHANGTVTTKQFINLAERVSGEKLDGLFRTWLYTPRKPKRF
jgi:aminopeptidase N